MTFFGILKIDPLEPCGNVFLFLPPSVGRNVVVTVCTGTDSQPVTACRLKLISAVGTVDSEDLKLNRAYIVHIYKQIFLTQKLVL